jgi:hypothetical protein
MKHTIDVLMPAARSASDVAALIDAARVLTFLARSRARERMTDPRACSIAQLEMLYRTASHVALQARQLVADTRRLLGLVPVGADTAESVLGIAHELDALHALLVASMEDAGRALDTLEALQELGIEQVQGGPLSNDSTVELVDYVQRLIERLKR